MRICVPSRGRPGNVSKMRSLAGGAELVWLVPPEEVDAYWDAGATAVVPSPEQNIPFGSPKSATMNMALDEFGGDWVLLMDDDLQSLKWLRATGEAEDISVNMAAQLMLNTAVRHKASLVGVLPYSNTWFAKPRTRQGFLKMSWMMLIAPGTRHRFDVTLPMGEDYDFTARVFSSGDWVARHDDIIPRFRVNDATSHYGSGPGRAVQHDRTNRLLIERWPGMFKPTVRGGLVDDLRFMIYGRNGD